MAEMFVEQVRWTWLTLRLSRIYWKVRFGQDRRLYTDEALSPVGADEEETHEMFDSAEAKAFLAREKRLADVRAGA
jgi:hypothetical protein